MAHPKPTLLGSILTGALLLYRTAFKRLFIISFVTALINQFLGDWAMPLITQHNGQLVLKNPYVFTMSLLIMLIVGVTGNTLMQIIINAQREGHKLSLMACFKITLHKLPSLILAGFIFYSLISLGMVLYIIPGLIIFTLLFVHSPAIIFDNHNPLKALAHSARLTSKHFLLVLSVVFISILVLYLPEILIHVTSTQEPNATSFGFDQMVQIFSQAIILPFTNAMTVLLYYMLKQLHAIGLKKTRPGKKTTAKNSVKKS